MQSFDPVLELRILKTLLDSKDSRLLTTLSPDWFGLAPAREVFHRAQVLRNNGKEVPSSQTMALDPVLSETSQTLLKGDVGAFPRDEVEGAIDQLNYFRKGRVILEMVKTVADQLKENNADLPQAVSSIESCLGLLQNPDVEDELLSYGGMDSEKVLEIHDKVLTQDASLKFIPTGYKVIDKQQGGLGRGRLYTIGAPSGGGKSTFANNLAVNAFQAGYSVRYCSFEMKREECHMRTQSLLTKIPHDKFQLGTLSPEERKKSDKALAKLLNDGEAKGKRLDYFCPARDITIAQLFSEIEHLKFDVVVVDYINLMKSLSPKMSLWENIGEAFRLAKKFAERNDCVLIMLVQVDEETGDVKYAKSIKHHSDGVWVWKWGDEEKETQMVEVDQVKLRNFKPTVFSLQAQFEYCSFTESFGMGSEINPEKPQLTPMKL